MQNIISKIFQSASEPVIAVKQPVKSSLKIFFHMLIQVALLAWLE